MIKAILGRVCKQSKCVNKSKHQRLRGSCAQPWEKFNVTFTMFCTSPREKFTQTFVYIQHKAIMLKNNRNITSKNCVHYFEANFM